MADHAWRHPGHVVLDDRMVRWLWTYGRLGELIQRVGSGSEYGPALVVLGSVAIRPGRIDQGPPLSPGQVAQNKGVNVRTVTRACEDERLPGAVRNETNRWEIPPEAADAWKPRARSKPDGPSTGRADRRA